MTRVTDDVTTGHRPVDCGRVLVATLRAIHGVPINDGRPAPVRAEGEWRVPADVMQAVNREQGLPTTADGTGSSARGVG